MMMDDQNYTQFQMGYDHGDNEMAELRDSHQCPTCYKIYGSAKGLQQHAVIHTEQKPFICDVCKKSFRFKSNLFEHRSIHSGCANQYECPYCNKGCRLKGNLKKHLRTHVTTKEELDAAWKPFESRRHVANVPEVAEVVPEEPYYEPAVPKLKKRRIPLGEHEVLVEKLRNGDLMPEIDVDNKIRRLENTIFNDMTLENWSSFLEVAKGIAYEIHDCPVCKLEFMSRSDCITHFTIAHLNHPTENFCEKCFRQFDDENSYNQHASFHTTVVHLMESGAVVPNPCDQDILVPDDKDIQLIFDELFF